MKTMLAAVLKDFGKLELEQVSKPAARNVGEVVVQIKSCGFCATDYKAIQGIRRNVGFPFIPGHEPSGVVVEIGPGVIHFKVDDEVICQPSGYCGFCEQCRTGNTHYCEHAFTTGGDGPKDVWPGAFAEYMLTRENCLFRKPTSLSFDAACLTEPLSGAWKGVIQYSEMKVGDDVVVIARGRVVLDTGGAAQEVQASIQLAGATLRPAAYDVEVRGSEAQRVNARITTNQAAW